MIPYLIHASVLIAGTYLIYSLLIKSETFFKLNRWVIISTLALSMMAPLVTIPSQWSLRTEKPIKTMTATSEIDQPSEVSIVTTTLDPNPGEVTNKQDVATEIVQPVSSSTLLDHPLLVKRTWWMIYLIGVTIFIITFLVQLIIILARTFILQSFKDGKYRIVELAKDQAPFSFWNSIFINPAKYDEETFQQILQHEKIHIDQSHFIDKLFGEFLVIVFWFNPFAWLSRTAISNNLEYLTDRSMLDKGVQKDKYQLSLLKVSVPQHPLYLTTNFNQSFLKNRIAMMNSKKSSARSTWKYLFIIPFFGLSILALNAIEPSDTAVERIADSKNTTTPSINPPAAEQLLLGTEIKVKNKDESNPIEKPCCDNEQEEWRGYNEKIVELQSILIDNLYNDGFTKTKDDVVFFEYLEDGIRVQEKPMDQKEYQKYNTLLNQYGLNPLEDRMYNVRPIVILSGAFTDRSVQQELNDPNAPFFPVSSTDQDYGSSKDLLMVLQKYLLKDELISSKKEKVIIELLPEKIVINKQKLSKPLDAKYRSLLKDYNLEGDTDGLRIIVPITILSGSLVTGDYSINFPSNETSSNSSSFDNEADYHDGTSDLRTYKNLLSHKKTLLPKNVISKNESHWQLPAFQKELSELLSVQQIISGADMIHMALLNNEASANGKFLERSNMVRLEKLFHEYNMPFVEGFRFLKSGNHIAILDPVPSIDDLKLDIIEHLYSNDLIRSKAGEILLEISGDRIKLNGINLSEGDMSSTLQILSNHNVTPSPGKVIQINRKGNIIMHLGYQIDKNYIGSMEFK